MTEDTSSGQRVALLLMLLRLSRSPDLQPALEVALTALDDGRRPWAAPPDEAAVLRRIRERLGETLEPESAHAWEAERRAGIRDSTAAIAAARLGKTPPASATPEVAEAIRAAGELLARREAEEAVAAGATTSAGWKLVARLELDGQPVWLPTALWALLSPDRTSLVLVATGGDVPEPWDWERVRAVLEARRQEMAAAEVFVRVTERIDPARRAERVAKVGALFREMDAQRAARESVEGRGGALLHLLDGQPVRAEGAVLVDAGGAEVGTGIEAQRLDVDWTAPFAGTLPARPWEQQVWARPVGDGLWRRGRLRPEADRVAFLDEPAATGPERGDGAPPDREPGRTLQRDLLASPAVRGKAAAAEVYARLLYLALENAVWRHADGTVFEGGQRSTAALVAQVVGAGDYLHWAWSAPTGLLDEEVLADLRALGWEPVRDGRDEPSLGGGEA